jgi:hypothetical protein
MSSKHGPTTSVTVFNDNLEGALKKYLKASSAVIVEHKLATDHYDKPSAIRHQLNQTKKHKILIEKEGRVISKKIR